MNLFLTLLALSLILVIIYFSLKKKKIEKKIINKSELKEEFVEEITKQNFEKTAEIRDIHEVPEVVEELKKHGAVRPEGNQQRNLDRETGGLEQEKYRETGEKDAWDDRSDQIDKEGSIDQLGSAAKKSMIWRYKKAKLDIEKHAKSADAAEMHHENRQGTGKSFDSRYGNQSGLNQILQARQDFSNDRGGGGMSR